MRKLTSRFTSHHTALAACLGLSLAAGPALAVAPTSVSQVPLTIAFPAHPEVLFAVGNSESMDGDLSGAIMTGSGSIPHPFLYSSSSPQNYQIPNGFTPPLNPGPGDGTAPYTVLTGAFWSDNSSSRLNNAKAGIMGVLNRFMADADFGLIDYNTGGAGLFGTWLYVMSPPGGFVFTNTQVAPNRYINNPCYNYTTLPVISAIYQDCLAIDTSGQVTGSMATNQYMQIEYSSDDPLINDVFYGGAPAVCLVYGGPNPLNPYAAYHLNGGGSYNANTGNIVVGYNHGVPGGCPTATTPTNAGFIPFQPQTMYVQRGWAYFSGQNAQGGNNPLVNITSAGQLPTPASVAAAIAQFTPHLNPETSNAGTPEIKAQAVQSPTPGLIHAAYHYYTTAAINTSNGCTAHQYVVLVSDGLPTIDFGGLAWPPPGTISGDATWKGGQTMVVNFNGDGSLDTGTTTAQAITDTVTQITNLKNYTAHDPAGIKTYVIGLGAGVDPSVNPDAANVLTAFAIAGGTGAYWPAYSSDALTADMQAILADILAQTQSTASNAVNTTGLHVGATAYQAQFDTADLWQDWTGDLHAYPINTVNGTVDTAMPNWSAQAQLDLVSWNSRLIATWDPGLNAGTPLRWDPALAPNGISTGTPLANALTTFAPDTDPRHVEQYLRGNTALEQRNGGQFRNRAHILGDIVDSAPLYIGIPSGPWQTADYQNFIAQHNTRAPIIYIGANDGMLHAFDAGTGAERFAFVPHAVWSNLINLVNPYYNAQHLFFVNGSPQAADVQFSDNHWHTVLVGGEAQGGNSIYALDITNADQVGTETDAAALAMWEFTDPDMGLSMSTPVIAQAAAGWAVFFGNGYDSANEKPFLYAVNPQTGAMLAKVDLCAAVPSACDLTKANGLSGVIAINSFGEATLNADTVYAGDLQGNLWRIDISNVNPGSWVVKQIFQATDAGGNAQPITSAPTVTLNPNYPRVLGTMVYFGTGQLLGLQDLATTGTQTLYGVYDPPGGGALATRANLVSQSLSSSTVGSAAVLVESAVTPVTIPTNRGWYVDLSWTAEGASPYTVCTVAINPCPPQDLVAAADSMPSSSGSRVVSDVTLEPGGVLVATIYEPDQDTCTGGGWSWILTLNYQTGGSFPLPELDVAGNGLGNGNQTANGLNPVGMSIGNVYGSAPTILRAAGTNIPGAYKMISESNLAIQSVGDRGGTKQRVSWWEVRH